MIKSNFLLITSPPKAKPYNKTFLELWQAWCHNDFPGEPVLVTDHPLSEEPSPNVQSELPLAQLHSMTLYPIVGYHWSYMDEHRCSSYRLACPLNPNCSCSFHSPLFQIISRASPSLPSSLELSRTSSPSRWELLLNPNETLISTTFMLPVEEQNLYFCKCPSHANKVYSLWYWTQCKYQAGQKNRSKFKQGEEHLNYMFLMLIW